MANALTPSWDPHIRKMLLTATIATIPGNSNPTPVVVDLFTIPKVQRPDLSLPAAVAATMPANLYGGSTSVRAVIKSVLFKCSSTAGDADGTFTARLINQSNASAVIASAVLVDADLAIAAPGYGTTAWTIATTSTTRGGVSVPDFIVFGGDILAFTVNGTNANDLIGIGSGIEVDWYFEEQGVGLAQA